MPYIDFKELERLDQSVEENGHRDDVSWESYAASDCGKVRDVNEDAYFNSSEQGLWAVADGMGGLARGDYASGVVVETLVHFCRSRSLAASVRDLEIRFREAHTSCRNAFKDERVGSTVAALMSHSGMAFMLWVGDSRVYRLRDGELKQLTCDHTLAQRKCALGQLPLNKVETHPSAHILTRAVGVNQTLHLDIDYESVQIGDRYLLCSDGLYNPLSFEDLQLLLNGKSLEEALTSLIGLALERGGEDNITAIVTEAVRAESDIKG